MWREIFIPILQSSPGEPDNPPAQRDSEVGAIGKPSQSYIRKPRGEKASLRPKTTPEQSHRAC